MLPGEFWIARFPFGGKIGAKVRPVLLLSGPLSTIPEFITAYITSMMPNPLLATDVVIDLANPDHSQSGITTTSVIRLHKISTIHRRDLIRKLGALPSVMTPLISSGLRSAIAY